MLIAIVNVSACVCVCELSKDEPLSTRCVCVWETPAPSINSPDNSTRSSHQHS